MKADPTVSVVICTYNRPALLADCLDALLNEPSPDTEVEVIVVDNNSTEETKAVIGRRAAKDSRVRYVHEPRQGNAFARNTGVENAQAPIVAFLDDDVVVRGGWLATLTNTFRDHEVDFIGGKVLPRWEQSPPSWLTHIHWAPIAAVDYGDRPLRISAENMLCLLTANIAFKRKLFERFGGFSDAVQRSGDSIGSLEDHEFLTRLMRAGIAGLYVPEMVVEAHVGRERMTKTYHRRWHTGHGHFYAVLRDPDWEQSRFQIAGLPAHLYKQAAKHAVVWCSRVLTRQPDAAFASECQLRFFYGFLRERTKASHSG